MSVNENQCIVLSKNYIIMYAKLFTCVENDLISQYKLNLYWKENGQWICNIFLFIVLTKENGTSLLVNP